MLEGRAHFPPKLSSSYMSQPSTVIILNYKAQNFFVIKLTGWKGDFGWDFVYF